MKSLKALMALSLCLTIIGCEKSNPTAESDNPAKRIIEKQKTPDSPTKDLQSNSPLRADFGTPPYLNLKVVVENLKGSDTYYRHHHSTGKMSATKKLTTPLPFHTASVPQTVLSKNRGGDGYPVEVILFGKNLKSAEILDIEVKALMRQRHMGSYIQKLIAVPKDKDLLPATEFTFDHKNFESDEWKSVVEFFEGPWEMRDPKEATDLIAITHRAFKKEFD